jgi:hypothetical protein
MKTQESFVENSHGRTDGDFYRTPALVTKALCDEFKLRGIGPKVIVDAGCGDGAIGMVCRQAWPSSRIIGVEINRERWAKASQTWAYDCVDRMDWIGEGPDDARDWSIPGISQADLIISNPAFKIALPSLRTALKRVRSGGHVAFLLISQYDQETVHDDERGRFLDSLRKPDGSEGYGQLKYKGRVDFRGDGNGDRVAYGWLVFGPGFEGSFVRAPRSPMISAEQLTMGIA